MKTDDLFTWVCQYCGEENEVWIDLTIEDKQDFVEECSICCRPNRIILSPTQEDDLVTVEVRLTDE